MSLLAIDPGKIHAYAAFFDDRLTEVRYGGPFFTKPSFARIVVELPEQRGRESHVRVSDLIELAFRGGQAGGPRAEMVPVSQWKGNKTKMAMHRRMLTKVLIPMELTIIRPYLENHNVLDAVCMGCVILERM